MSNGNGGALGGMTRQQGSPLPPPSPCPKSGWSGLSSGWLSAVFSPQSLGSTSYSLLEQLQSSGRAAGFVLVCYDRELDFTVIALESPVNGIRSH